MRKDDVGFTVVENELLNRMAAGELDCVIDGDRCFWLAIRDGVSTQYMEHHTKKSIVNGEIQRSLGDVRIYREWKTEDEKLMFLREHGSKIADPLAQEYAAKTSEKKEEVPVRRLLLPLTDDVLRNVYSFDLGVRTLS